MSIAISTLLDELGLVLHDPDSEVWTQTTRLAFLNEAINTIALLRPDATAKTSEVALVADTPKQEIPSGGNRLLYVTRNVNTGTPIRKITREDLNDIAVTWAPQTVVEIDHYMFDDENPRGFYVFPVPDSVLPIEIVYSDTPAPVTAASTSMGISDVYLGPVKDYVLARCFRMETKGADYGKSDYHMQLFYNALGVKLQNEGILRAVQGE